MIRPSRNDFPMLSADEVAGIVRGDDGSLASASAKIATRGESKTRKPPERTGLRAILSDAEVAVLSIERDTDDPLSAEDHAMIALAWKKVDAAGYTSNGRGPKLKPRYGNGQ